MGVGSSAPVSSSLPSVPGSLDPSERLLSSHPLLAHSLLIQGLPGAGVRTVRRQLGIRPERSLTIDPRFLTSPPLLQDERFHVSSIDYPPPDDPKSLQQQQLHDTYHAVNEEFDLWSYGGRASVTPRWKIMMQNMHGIILVVDATDRKALGLEAPATTAEEISELATEGKTGDALGRVGKTISPELKALYDERAKRMLASLTVPALLKKLFGEPGEFSPYHARHLQRKPLLVLATHSDQPDALGATEIAAALDLTHLCARCDWRVSCVDAVHGDGMSEAAQWLACAMQAPTQFDQQQIKKNRTDEQHAEMEEKDTLEETNVRSNRGDSVSNSAEGSRSHHAPLEVSFQEQSTIKRNTRQVIHRYDSLSSTAFPLPSAKWLLDSLTTTRQTKYLKRHVREWLQDTNPDIDIHMVYRELFNPLKERLMKNLMLPY